MTMYFVSWLLGFLTGLMFLIVWIDNDVFMKRSNCKTDNAISLKDGDLRVVIE